ncbi:entry exclusion lipoprotein TrbK [Pseudomonas sp. NPDC089401]|uniref:entry exclusion lipoprotein TrbK n=1 Tax=Pseudomonas sp. NPDC089401 TaxID=3364462 RepID=UPI00381E4C7D
MKMIVQPLAILMAVFALSACGKGSADYEVNATNCAPEHVKTLPEGAKRDTLVEGCMSR